MKAPTPRRLLRYVSDRLRLRGYLGEPGDGRPQPRIPARVLVWAILISRLLRQASFHAVEQLVRRSGCRALSLTRRFGDDALSYFTERLEAGETRTAATIRCARPSNSAGNSGSASAGRRHSTAVELLHPRVLPSSTAGHNLSSSTPDRGLGSVPPKIAPGRINLAFPYPIAVRAFSAAPRSTKFRNGWLRGRKVD